MANFSTDFKSGELSHRKVQNVVTQSTAAKRKLSVGDVSVGIGKTWIEIIRQVLLHHHDLVIKTARGRTDGRRISFGTTGMHLIRKCPCPVWLVAPGAKASPKRILAAVNPTGRDRAAMAKRVLGQALDLAQQFGATLHVLDAWNPRVESLVQPKQDDVTLHRVAPCCRKAGARGPAQHGPLVTAGPLVRLSLAATNL